MPIQSDTTNSANTIAAYFHHPKDAESAIDALTSAGFAKHEIGVAVQDQGNSEQKSSDRPGLVERFKNLFSPGDREEYEGTDDLDVLHHMGIEQDDAQYYRQSLHRGGVLLTVNAAGRTAEARSILERFNAEFPSATNMRQPSTSANTGRSSAGASGTQRIQLLGEILRVHKEKVRTGSVTLRKDVVTERQEVEVPVVREELVIERHPVQGREAVAGDFEPGKQITVELNEERARVEKQPVVREEVEVGKRQVQDTRRVAEEVSHEELRVNREGDVAISPTEKAELGREQLPRRKAS